MALRRHGVEEMGGVVGPRLKSSLGGDIVRHSVSDGNMDAHLLRGLDKLDGTGLFRGHGDQLHASLCRLLKAAEHGNVRIVEESPVLGALFRHAQEGPLQVGAHHLRAAGVLPPVGGGGLADGRQLVLRQGHARRAEIGHALTELKVRDFLQSLRRGVAEILSYAAVEVDVHQTGDHIAAVGVQRLPAAAGMGDQRAVGTDVPGCKSLFQVKDLTAGYPHTQIPAWISLPRAASSPTNTTSSWSWRMEPGQRGVMGPQTAL